MRAYQKTFDGTLTVAKLEEMRKAQKDLSREMIDGRNFVLRNTWGSLRGYHLLPNPAEKFGSIVQDYSFGVIFTKGLVFQFYISEPFLMTEDDVYVVKFDTYRHNNPIPAQTYVTYHYRLKVQRLNSQSKFEFSLTRLINGAPNGAETKLSLPYSGTNQDWIHFTFSVGSAMLYHIDEDRIRVKRVEQVRAWFGEVLYKSQLAGYYETVFRNDIFYKTTGRASRSAEISLEAYSDKAMTTSKTTNDFGLRLWEFAPTFGIMPFDEFGEPHQSPTAEEVTLDKRCLIQEIDKMECIAYVFMKNKDETNDYAVNTNKFYEQRSQHCPQEECRFCKYGSICMFAKDGVNEDLYIHDQFRYTMERWPGTRYDPNKPEIARRFIKITNNLGKDYWVRCPPNCKDKLLFRV